MSEVTAAPAAAPAAAPQVSAQAAPVAAPQTAATTEVSVAPSAEPKTFVTPDPVADPIAWESWHHQLQQSGPMSVQEYNEALAQGKISYTSEAEAQAPPQPQGEQPLDAGIPPEVAAPETPSEQAPLTQEQFDALPENVQNLLLSLDEQSGPGEWAPLAERGVTPAALEKFVSDPVIEMRMKELAGQKTIEIPDAVKDALNPDMWMSLAAEKIESLDFAGDPEGTVATVKEILSTALATAAEAGAANIRIEHQQREQQMAQRNWLESQISSLAAKNPALNSTLNFTDPAHPARPFLMHLAELRSEGGMPFESIKKLGVEGLWIAWQASQGGGFNKIYEQAQAKTKQSLLAHLKKRAIQAHTTVGPDTQSQNANPMMRNGIDGARYLSDPAYAEAKFDEALHMASMNKDKTLMNELSYLRANGRWA